ncbi:glycosyltransferase [Granulicella sp. S156]|uniref:CgeB family protein n=1 Tax=Granulicella sp. S156 TaxID=1747224 RepID=UPI00131E24D3|nr:glycosyltransferase [Granulicella sp. S156]
MMDRPLKVLYAAGLSPNDSSQYRLWALERLGHKVVSLNAYSYEPQNAILKKIVYRVQSGPWVARLNRDILAMAEREKPDIFWADKLLGLRPETLDKLRAMGIVSASYMIDNAFGPRRDPGWRLYMKDIPHFDLHVVQRDKNIADYKASGARDVIKIQTAYEPTLHFPPPIGWSDNDRDRGVSFIGTPYDDRAQFLTRLWKEFGLPIVVSGGLVWKKALGAEATDALYRGHGELFRGAYREGIWKSKINLSFITHANQDEFVHKSFEIAACRGFLLAERSPGHMARFVEDEEAVFFSGIEECVTKIRRYLPNEAARERIAAAGCARAERDGYHNDAQIAAIVQRLRTLRADRGLQA